MAEPGDMETTTPVATAFISGAIAGFTEHLVMFPVDTIKTRLQVAGTKGMPVYSGIRSAFAQITAAEGGRILYRGLPAVLLAAAPSHAAYFSALEATKSCLPVDHRGTWLGDALTGAAATIAHDIIVTPLDVVKQRMQVHKSPYRSSWLCFRDILAREGPKALYASYSTTLAMNVPFMALFVSIYEATKRQLYFWDGAVKYIVAAGVAGSISGAATTPLDVLKTRIQVEGLRGPSDAAARILQQHGYAGFFRGSLARGLYFTPSAAICWSTYEIMKNVFGMEIGDSLDDLVPI